MAVKDRDDDLMLMLWSYLAALDSVIAARQLIKTIGPEDK